MAGGADKSLPVAASTVGLVVSEIGPALSLAGREAPEETVGTTGTTGARGTAGLVSFCWTWGFAVEDGVVGCVESASD